MSATWSMVKREIQKVFKSKKMLTAIFVMPVLLIGMMAFLSGLQQKNMGARETERSRIFLLNGPVWMRLPAPEGLELRPCTQEELKEIRERKELTANDAVVEFTDGMHANIYYYSIGGNGPALVSYIENTLLPGAERSWYRHDTGYLDGGVETVPVKEDMSTGEERKNLGMGAMLPYLMILLLFLNIVNVVSDSIAGEKEKGTLSKLMLTPVKNRQIVAAKVIGNTLIGLISSCVYIVCLFLISAACSRFLKLDPLNLSGASLGVGQLLLLLCCFVLTGLLFVALVTLLSAVARTVKETTGLVMPFYILTIAAALLSMVYSGGASSAVYLIPVYNVSLLMRNIILGAQIGRDALFTFLSLGILAVVLGGLAVRRFYREEILY